MDVQLTAPQVAWLRSRVADGTFSSMDDAISELLEERIALEEADLDWAKELVDEGRSDVDSGRVMTGDEHRSRNQQRREKLAR